MILKICNFRTLVTKDHKIQLDTSLQYENMKNHFPLETRLNKALKLKSKNRKYFLFRSLGKCCSEADPGGGEGGCGE